MEFGKRLSAKQMAAVSGLGGVLAASGFLLPSPRYVATPHPYYPLWVWATLMFGFLVGGTAVSLVADAKLKEGIGNERWSGDEVDSLRALMGSPLWNLLVGALLLGSLLGMIFLFPAPHHRFGGVTYALMIAGQTVARLTWVGRKPPVDGPRGPVWQGFSPIRSEHWGER
jgi:hypothetical protein